MNFLTVLGVGISEFLFLSVTTNHFSGWEIWLYLTSHFCPGVGNLTIIFWKMSKSRPMPPFPPYRLDIDRCINIDFTIILWYCSFIQPIIYSTTFKPAAFTLLLCFFYLINQLKDGIVIFVFTILITHIHMYCECLEGLLLHFVWGYANPVMTINCI